MDDQDGSSEPVQTRFVPLEADPIAMIVQLNGTAFLVVDLTAGCECHPDDTLLVQRRHCLS